MKYICTVKKRKRWNIYFWCNIYNQHIGLKLLRISIKEQIDFENRVQFLSGIAFGQFYLSYDWILDY
jgi:hypothetical protein